MKWGAGAIAQDGINARVLPDNDPDAWAEAIALIAGNPDVRIDIGEKARERANQFTWRKVAAQRAGLLKGKYPFLWNQ